MRWLAVFFILLAGLLPLSADDWTTTDGTTYKDVTVVQVADDGLTITYTGGGPTKIPYYNLPLEVQKQYGHDPETLANKLRDAEDAEATKKAAAAEAERLQAEQQKQLADQAAQLKALQAARDANHPHAAASTSTTEQPNRSGDRVSYPGAEYSYNKFQDICSLDSLPVAALPLPAAPGDTSNHTVLVLRSYSAGAQPHHADKILVTIMSMGTPWKLADDHSILFLVDGVSMPIDDTQIRDNDFLAGLGQVVQFVSFYLTDTQAQALLGAKDVKFYIGDNNYTLDKTGLATLQKYQAVLAPLPIPPSPLVQKYNELSAKIPSIPTLISKTCEYVILGGFSIVVLLGFLACCLGAARFMRW